MPTKVKPPAGAGPTALMFVLLPAAAVGALALALSGAERPPCPPAERGSAAVTQPLAAIRYLAADALEGRLAGSAGERCAGDYIAREFRRLGIEPLGDSGGYFQAVPLASALNPHAPGGTGRNVVAVLAGSNRSLAREYVVIGAHYDHLGRGGFGSLAPEAKDSIHNGADDNASGVAGVLEAARLLRASPPARSVIFVAFSGEEFGLLGSAHFAAHAPVPLEAVRAMLNLDMVGRLGAGPLLVYGTETAAEWAEIVTRAAAQQQLPIAARGDGYGASDHTSFYVRDIPVLHFFTNVHSDYHRPSDDFEKIDGPGLERVAALVATVARTVADRPAALTLQRGAGQPLPAAQGPGYGAYLGTVPDFTPVEHGVRLSGVRAGSPAEQAGLRAGDILVRFNDRDIADLFALTAALRAAAPGDTARIGLLRGGEDVTVTAILGRRGT
ncbi:MAG: M28 family peptidase [Gemmatimonadetes bacterium]|nr:M28 family peptidase [Gemmatimonadota bacterium]